MDNVKWFEDNGISQSLNRGKDLSKLTWDELRTYAKDKGIDLGKYRSREDIEKQLKEG